MARRWIFSVVVILLLGSGAARPVPVDSGAFKTTAKFSVDSDEKVVKSAVATIEPRLGAAGYSWLRIYFYSFPLTVEDVQVVSKGNIDALEKKSRDERKNARAMIQLSVDREHKVWQVDMSIPGNACTIAGSETDVKNFLQSYKFDGKNLELKSKGSSDCDMSFMKMPNKKYSWEIHIENLPVFEKATGK